MRPESKQGIPLRGRNLIKEWQAVAFRAEQLIILPPSGYYHLWDSVEGMCVSCRLMARMIFLK